MAFIFDIIFFIYFLFYFPYLILTRRLYKGILSRFGLFSKDTLKRLYGHKHIWIHAVSVGEVLAIRAFIEGIKEKYPQHRIVLTVTTKTGYALAVKQYSNLIVIPSPLDFSWVVKYFIKQIKPLIYIAAETEIWPNLFKALSDQQCQIVIINGRISDRSFGRYQMAKNFLKETLNRVSLWAMQSHMDADRIIELGANKENVFVTGNVKFDQIDTQDLTESLLPPGFLWFVAGSTHPGEEEIMLDMYERLQKENKRWRLCIAPRHVERTQSICHLIHTRKLKFSLFSQGINNEYDIVVVDTIGHLKSIYASADIVFVGKSLCVGGGHNIIEPAIFSKPIIIGPKMENFRDITAAFNVQGSIVQVDSPQMFIERALELAANPGLCSLYGKKARHIIDENKGAIKRTLEMIHL